MLPERLKGKLQNVHGIEANEPLFFWKDSVESACDFFLRYKDNPKLFEKEQFRIEPFYQKFKWYVSDESFGLVEYNEWLFRFAFADAMGVD